MLDAIRVAICNKNYENLGARLMDTQVSSTMLFLSLHIVRPDYTLGPEPLPV